MRGISRKRTFAQFVAWLRTTDERFYEPHGTRRWTAEICPLAIFMDRPVGNESDVLVTWPDGLIEAFDSKLPTNGKAALRILAAKGWIPQPKKRR